MSGRAGRCRRRPPATTRRLIADEWHKETCEAVVKAVDGWEGRGARKGVTVDQLNTYH